MAKDTWLNVLEQFRRSRKIITDEIAKAVIGQSDIVDQMLAAVFSRGHCLLVGVPGLAKTLMVSTLSRIMTLRFKRIQFTPDLMPTDITGAHVLEDVPLPGGGARRDFRFVPGPVFANIILADEINRTPPKTQAALLQAMQEREVTVGRETHPLPDPFFVIATQNPIEQEGTYPLPEAQQDRFMFSLWVDYPTPAEERRILARTAVGTEPELQTVLNDRQVLNMQRLVAQVPVSDFVIEYAARLIRASRPRDETAPEHVRRLVEWGAGPRAGQYLLLAGKAFAAMAGRPNVAPEDIRRAATPVLRHRVSCNFIAQSEGIDSVEVIRRLIEEVPEPELSKYKTTEPPPPDWTPVADEPV